MRMNDIKNSLEIIRSRLSMGNQRMEEVRDDLEDAKRQIKTQNKRIRELEDTLKQELQRRDYWQRKEAEIRYLAGNRKVWVIKCPSPDSNLRFHGGKYGDYAYCLTIQRHLQELGIYAVIDCYEDWNCTVDADVVLVIRGIHDYHPDRRNPRTKYVLWMVSHPELVDSLELDLYDLVLVDSASYADVLRKETETPVESFYILTDTRMFYPAEQAGEKPQYNRVFIGNTRGILRNCVRWCNDNHIEVDVWGAEWEKYYPDSVYVHLHGQVAYEEIPDIYRKSRVVINDHYDDMLATEMMNNRFPEVLLCGTPMICDWAESFERDYGDMVLFYRNEEEFVQCIKEMDERYDELKANVMKNQERLREEFDFQKGIARMQALIESCGEESEAR